MYGIVFSTGGSNSTLYVGLADDTDANPPFTLITSVERSETKSFTVPKRPLLLTANINDFPNPGKGSQGSITFGYVQVFENTSQGATFVSSIKGYVIAYPLTNNVYIECNAYA